MAPKYFPHFIVKIQTKYWLFLYQKKREKMKNERREVHRRWSRSLDGLGVAFQVLMPEDSGSNPEVGSIYSFDEVCPGLGLLQPQWNPYPTLTLPSWWVRHVRSIGGPQYGLAVCCVVSACDSTDSKEISNDGNPSHPHLFASFQHSSLDGTQVGSH